MFLTEFLRKILISTLRVRRSIKKLVIIFLMTLTLIQILIAIITLLLYLELRFRGITDFTVYQAEKDTPLSLLLLGVELSFVWNTKVVEGFSIVLWYCWECCTPKESNKILEGSIWAALIALYLLTYVSKRHNIKPVFFFSPLILVGIPIIRLVIHVVPLVGITTHEVIFIPMILVLVSLFAANKEGYVYQMVQVMAIVLFLAIIGVVACCYYSR